jgi:guanylate cyclase
MPFKGNGKRAKLRILSQIEQRVVLPGDSETRHSQKTISTALMFATSAFSLLNMIIALGQGFTAAAVVYSASTLIVLSAAGLILAFPRFWLPILSAVILAIIPIILAVHVYSGGFQSGLEIAAWMLQAPLAAALFIGPRFTVVSLVAYVAGVIAAASLEPTAGTLAPALPPDRRAPIAAINLVMLGLLATAAGLYLLQRVEFFRRRADALLLNILPAPVARRLKTGLETIADRYADVTVLFADIAGSTALFASLKPAEAVDWLNEVFVMCDDLVEKHGLEKIKTIGDSYMVAAGVPVPRADHAQAMAAFALEMVRGLEELPPRHGQRLAFRVGMHSGPLVAGVIGRSKFQYDLWGDTVNVASRMESHGEVGKVQITAATYDRIKDEFDCVSRGRIPVKDKGEMATWFLERAKMPIDAGAVPPGTPA